MKGYSSRNEDAIYGPDPTSEQKSRNKRPFLRGVPTLPLTRELWPDELKSVLRVKVALDLFDRPMTDPNLKARILRSEAHLDLSLEVARQSMTLPKNDGHLLPLSISLQRIAMIGPNGDVARYGDCEKESNGENISILQGIRDLDPGATVDFNYTLWVGGSSQASLTTKFVLNPQ